MSLEFVSKGTFQDALIAYKHEFRRAAKNAYLKVRGLKRQPEFELKQRYSELYAKKVVLRKKLALSQDGKLSWFYTAFERQDADALTNYTLKYIEDNIAKDSKILVSGCGTGITAFHLADCRFKEVVGIDLLPQCIDIANTLKKDFQYDNTRFIVDDGLKPMLNEKFDLITALHWVFSAWMGNYGNSPVVNPYDAKVREEALNSFLSNYSNLLVADGQLIIELIDAVADYRLPADHFMGDYSTKIYPIRHTPEQVQKCAFENGFEVLDKKLSVSYGHQPRTCYYLKKVKHS